MNPLQMVTYKGDSSEGYDDVIKWININLTPKLISKANIPYPETLTLEYHQKRISIKVKNERVPSVVKQFKDAGLTDIKIEKDDKAKNWISKVSSKGPAGLES